MVENLCYKNLRVDTGRTRVVGATCLVAFDYDVNVYAQRRCHVVECVLVRVEHTVPGTVAVLHSYTVRPVFHTPLNAPIAGRDHDWQLAAGR